MSGDFSYSYAGMALLLNSPEMAAGLMPFAKKIQERAEQTAPVGDPDVDPHSGRYKKSFGIRVKFKGGLRGDRVELMVYNDSPEAIFVEKGTSNQDGQDILMRAATAGGGL